MPISRVHLRRLHIRIAPIVFLPILLTLLTGSLFQIAVLTGHSNEFFWLLEWHRGKFGRINLEMIYPFLNAFGSMMLAITGILLWFRARKGSSM
ncbi:MAG: PepSY domain-containing protein [Xenococcaceae cyanobacterium MO_188.B29]|nr:PepSY domain-containing protein [Xenococcaceae cyanobacterium MO_188.B29]